MGEARLTIHVQGDRVRIAGNADLGRDRLLVGRKPDDALRLITLLHNLCPTAHRLAATLAMGGEASPDDARLLAREILVEHALVILRDWPSALGMTPDAVPLRGLSNLTMDRLIRLENDLFGMPAQRFLRIDDIGEVISAAPPVALYRLVADLPVPATGGGDDDPTFFARCLADPMVASAVAGRGVTLALRMLARLREAARVINELLSGEHAPRFQRRADGVGAVEAARGRLVHRVRIEGGIIRDYAIETPTDIMTRPDGFLLRLLTGALAAPPSLREKVLAIALSSADPCLPVEIEREAA